MLHIQSKHARPRAEASLAAPVASGGHQDFRGVDCECAKKIVSGGSAESVYPIPGVAAADDFARGNHRPDVGERRRSSSGSD